MDRELYRRRQRRRAIVGWSVGGLLVVLVALGVILGGEQHHSTASIGLFSAEMSSRQYEEIHRGESEAVVLERLHGVGLREGEVEDSQLLDLLPARPANAICSFWTLSDAPSHLVRLCFSDPQDVLLQKSVAAAGEDAAPTTLV